MAKMKSAFFEREIQLIKDNDLRDFVRYVFDVFVGEWFWKSGASASGKYHPQFTKGIGGLVRHTRAVVMVCAELLKLNSYAYMNETYKDYAIVACLLHDIGKYGTTNKADKSCYAEHGKLASEIVDSAWSDFFPYTPTPELLLMAIRSHMGQWTQNPTEKPFTQIDRLVHLSDYIASRSFFDIPQIMEEYKSDYWFIEDEVYNEDSDFHSF